MKRLVTLLLEFPLALLVLLPVQSSAQPALEDSESRPRITIALVDTFSPGFYINTYFPTVRHLVDSLPQYKFNVVEIDYRNLDEQVQAVKPAFLVSSASTFVSLIEKTGAHQVATRKPVMSSNVANTVASCFIVPSGSRITDLARARGCRVAISSRESFDGWIIAKGEIEKRFGRSDSFFKEIVETQYAIPDVAMMLKMGEADIGVLSTCEYESLIETGQIRPDEFRVIDGKKSENGCIRSTDQYPDVVFSSFPNVDSQAAADVTVALLSMPSVGLDFSWTIANDFIPTYRLLRTLHMGPYAPQKWTWGRVWREYRTEILLLTALAAAFLFHVVTVNILVRKRTKQLSESLEETKHFFNQAEKSRMQLLRLERLNIVSQLSSMFAHEIKQPLMNISLYAGALRMLLKKEGALSDRAGGLIDNLEQELDRTSEIVEHVRGYAKQIESCRENIRPCKAVEAALDVLRMEIPVETSSRCTSDVSADPFELQFIIQNFIKNAAEAAVRSSAPKIKIEDYEENGKAVIAVSDNGPAVSDEAFGMLGRASQSSKPDGLGFGLSIAVRLAEKMGGHIDFERLPEGGLKARLVMEKAREEEGGGNGRR